jgi:hypothetical protein
MPVCVADDETFIQRPIDQPGRRSGQMNFLDLRTSPSSTLWP